MDYSVRTMSFAENLRYELTYQGLFVKELAAKTGININTLNHYLSGRKSMPPADAAVKIAATLGVTVEYLVTGMAGRKQGAGGTGLANLSKDIETYMGFRDIIEDLKSLPDFMLPPVKAMIRAAARESRTKKEQAKNP
ncbi:MAG: helix-turn-helix domain-containing protein [Spirochaetaceae bacterium]|jgi:transcriptional regulator with XRE-family HTH domain|nr:helix-turn-helix domain-containing protein [Spirochaetaceae bacterium]